MYLPGFAVYITLGVILNTPAKPKGASMFTTISTSRISTGTIYKLWFIGLFASMLPLSTLLGVLSAFGFNTVIWNGQPLHGVSGLFGGPLIGIFISVLFTAVFGSAAAFGLWLFSKFKPITVAVKGNSQAVAN